METPISFMTLENMINVNTQLNQATLFIERKPLTHSMP